LYRPECKHCGKRNVFRVSCGVSPDHTTALQTAWCQQEEPKSAIAGVTAPNVGDPRPVIPEL
jgi:hypothetical protein